MPKILFFLLLLTACTYDKKEVQQSADYKGYPPPIANIILTKCAVSGCHNEASYSGADGVLLNTYSNLFKGGDNGAIVIPFRADQSSLMYFTNVYSDLGPTLVPSMPYNRDPLSRSEVEALRDWINKGAPDVNGNLYYAEDPTRSKVYVTNQGCNTVFILDAKTRLPMRVINVGNPGSNELPHQIKFSDDGRFWYVVFSKGSIIQKYRTSDDVLAATYSIGNGTWTTIALSHDNKMAYIADYSPSGKIAILDMEANSYLYLSKLANPHGLHLSPDNNTLYCTAQSGNFIYKINVSDPANYQQLSLDGKPINYSTSLDPHEILFTGSNYFVTCQGSNEVRVFKAANDSLLAVVHTGVFPQEMAVAPQSGYLFVTCTEDSLNAPANTRGSVSVIGLNNFATVRNVYGFYQPHGLGVDEKDHLVFIANRNVNPSGPVPHHSASGCSGRDGFMQLIDLQTLNLVPGYKTELTSDPYAVAFLRGTN